MTKLQPSLVLQAEETLRRMPGYEDIDAVMRDRPHSELKRGDCFFESRTVILEQKEILNYQWQRNSDFHDFTQEMTARYGIDPSTRGLKVDQLSESEITKFRRIVLADVKIIRSKLEEANRQIRATKLEFNLPNASGVLLLISDTSEYLKPQSITLGLDAAIRMKLPSGDPRYPHVESIVVFARARGFLIKERSRFNFIMSRDSGRAYQFSERLLQELSKYGRDGVRGNDPKQLQARIVPIPIPPTQKK